MSLILWLGIILFSGGWLFATSLFAQANPVLAAISFAIGTLVLVGSASVKHGSLRVGGRMLMFLGGVAIVQFASIQPLTDTFAQLHRVDWLVHPLDLCLTVLGFEPTTVDGRVFVQAKSHLLPFTVNAEKLALIPATWVLLAGSLGIAVSTKARLWRRLGTFWGVVAVYLFVRLLVLVVVTLSHPDPFNLVSSHAESGVLYFQFPFFQWLSFLPLAVLAAVAVPLRIPKPKWEPSRARVGSLVAVAIGVAALTFSAAFEEPGPRNSGRVLFDEYHSPGWEPSICPFGTDWYGRRSVYNYATFLKLLRQHYPVDVNQREEYSEELLADYDVLVLRTATRAFAKSEVDAIARFVEGGGGVWIIGDHTNLLGMSRNLNAVSERFGIRFNFDAANRLDTGRFHDFEPSLWSWHPVTSGFDRIEFMTSCTLDLEDPAYSVMTATNTFSDPLDYSAPSFFGNVTPDLDEDFGLHVMGAAAEVGAGRVLAFSDSTIFSTFGVMLEGRPELVLGSIEYLNRRAAEWTPLNRSAAGVGLFLCLVGGWGARRRWRSPTTHFAVPVCIAAGLLLGTAAGTAASSAHHVLPEAIESHPDIAFLAPDRGDFYLPPSVVTAAEPAIKSFDSLFVIPQRLGYMPRVASLESALTADAVVILNPKGHFRDDEVQSLVEYVSGGGRLLVMDTILNRQSSLAQLLAPFQLGVKFKLQAEQNKFADPSWIRSNVSVAEFDDSAGELPSLRFGNLDRAPLRGPLSAPALSLLGGSSLFQTERDRAQAVTRAYGEGRVVAVVDSTAFSRAILGETTSEVDPGSDRRAVYELAYRLFRDFLMSEPIESSEDDSNPPGEVARIDSNRPEGSSP